MTVSKNDCRENLSDIQFIVLHHFILKHGLPVSLMLSLLLTLPLELDVVFLSQEERAGLSQSY